MKNEKTLKQGMDLKRLVLCLQGKLWLLLILAIVGAVIGGVSYQIAKAMRMPIVYEGVSKLYISFGVDESGEVYQYYNGYTWNELLDTDPIVDCMEEYLPKGYTRDDLIVSTKGEIISDIRLLTVTVSGSTEKYVREIQQAVEKGLADYAANREELRRIEVIRSIEPTRVYWDDKTVTACIIGGVVMAVITALVLAILYILDEAVYVPGDIEKKYGYKALGVMPRNQKGLQPYARELTANIFYILGENRKFALVDMDGHSESRSAELEKLLNAGENEYIGGDGEMGGLTWTLPKAEGEEKAENAYEILPFDEGAMTGEDCEKIRALCGVILLIPFGTDKSRKLQRIISLLKNQDCNVLGMIVYQDDEDFLNKYYE